MSLKYDLTKVLEINDPTGDLKKIWIYASENFGKSRFTADDIVEQVDSRGEAEDFLSRLVACYIFRKWGDEGYGCKHIYDDVMNAPDEIHRPSPATGRLPHSRGHRRSTDQAAIREESQKTWMFWGGVLGALLGVASFIEFFVYPGFSGSGIGRGDAFFHTLAEAEQSGKELDFLYMAFGSLSFGSILGAGLGYLLSTSINS